MDITIDYGMADVVADHFDAGIRLGGDIARDMIAVRIGPDIPMAIVGAPAYFGAHPAPTSPARLVDHRAINLRVPTSRTINGWRLMGGGREVRVRLDGHGLAYLLRDMVQADLDAGHLVHVLGKFTPDLPGYHLYYPNRRNASAAFQLLVETVRHVG